MAENASAAAHASATAARTRAETRTHTPSYEAYQILHVAFTIAPLIAGADKFFHFLVNWDQYLSPMVIRMLPIPAHTFMLGVGVIEIVAALLVALRPAIGAWIVGLWLCGIIVNLLTIPAYFDVALRDFGLALGAFALARLAAEYDRR
jgi:hypothetical protein